MVECCIQFDDGYLMVSMPMGRTMTNHWMACYAYYILLFSDKATSMLVDTAGSGAVWPTTGTVSEMLRGCTSRWYSWWDWVVWTSEIETKQQFGQSWGLAANRKVSYICQLGSLGTWEILGSMEGRRLPGLDPKPSISSKGERLDYDCQRGAAVAWLKASNQYIRCFP